MRFSVLIPDTAWPGWGEDLNEDSLVLLVEYGEFQALFTGDAGFPAEARYRRRSGRSAQGGASRVAHRQRHAWLAGFGQRRGPECREINATATRRRRRSRGWPGTALHRRTDRDGTIDVETDGRP